MFFHINKKHFKNMHKKISVQTASVRQHALTYYTKDRNVLNYTH